MTTLHNVLAPLVGRTRTQASPYTQFATKQRPTHWGTDLRANVYATAMLLGGHFVLEAVTRVQADWREVIVVWLFAAALAWNLATILYKQHVYRSSDDGEMDR